MREWSEFSVVLQPSQLGGVGVFAAHDIAKGTQVFTSLLNPRKMKVSDIPEEFRKYIIYLNDEECHCPQAFNRMEIGWYINHSAEPNINKASDGLVYALRDIKKGEEIFINYNYLNEPEHLKEDYYK